MKGFEACLFADEASRIKNMPGTDHPHISS